MILWNYLSLYLASGVRNHSERFQRNARIESTDNCHTSKRNSPCSTTDSMELILTKKAISQCNSTPIGILVGQRATLSCTAGKTDRCTVVCVVPCGDASLVVEQVECIEEVLPANICVVGVSLSSKSTPCILPSLKDHDHYTAMVELRCTDSLVQAVSPCSAGRGAGKDMVPTKVSQKEVIFSLVDCVIHSPLCTMPLLVSGVDGAKLCVDLESSQPIALTSTISATSSRLTGKQLGCAVKVTPSFPLVVCLSETSGKSISTSLAQFVARFPPGTEQALQCLPSRQYAPLVYCHTSVGEGSTADFLEVIDEGMSEQMSVSTHPGAQATASSAPKQSRSSGLQPIHLMILVGSCVGICAILYSLLGTK